MQQWKSKQWCYRCSIWAGYPRGAFPQNRNPPLEWLFTVAMDSWSLQSILVMDSTLSPVLHSCLKHSVTIIVYSWKRCEQRAMIMGCRFILDKKIGMGQPPRELRMQTSLVLIQLLTLTKLKIYGALCACGCNVKSSWHWGSWKDQNEKQSGPNQLGINCFVNCQLIYNYPEEKLLYPG